MDIEEFNVESGHQCASFLYLLCEEGSDIFDNFPELDLLIPIDTKISLVDIGGCVTCKDPELTENKLLEQTTFYYQK